MKNQESANQQTNSAQAVLKGIGHFVSPDRARLSATVLRRRGVAFLGGLAIAAPIGVALANRIADENSSNIPTSEQSFNPRADKRVTIPVSGAFGLASEVDPSHDPRIGVAHMQEQLRHQPEPGDTVVVPK